VVLSASVVDSSDALEILGLGTAVLDDYAPDFFGEVLISGAQLILKADGRLTHANYVEITNGGRLFLDNRDAAHNDRIGSTADIGLYAGTLAFDPGDFGFLTQEVGTIYLTGGANQIDLHLGSAAGGQLLANYLEVSSWSTATLSLRYIDSTGGTAPANVHFALQDSQWLYSDSIIPWATITQSDGVQVDWVAWEDGVTTVFNPFTNYETGSPADWLPSHNVLIDGSTATLPGQFDFLEINSLKLANGGVLDLGNDNELALSADGILSSGSSNVRITGEGILSASQAALYIHVHSPSLSVEGGAAIVAMYGGLVKAGGGTLHLSSPDIVHEIEGLYIHEGTVSLTSGTIILGNDRPGWVTIGDGKGTDILELPANRTNPITSAFGLPSIILHGTPYGATPDSGAVDAAILRFGGGTVQNVAIFDVKGRGTLDFVGGTESAPNMLYIEIFSLADFETTMLFIRHWEDKRDFLLVRHNSPNINTINAEFLSRIWFEGYDGPGAQWVYWSDEYWEIKPFPEPSTYGAILGVLGLGLVTWRRKRWASPVYDCERPAK